MELEEDRTPQDITALGHSVTVIDNMVNATVDANLTVEDRDDAIGRNVRHIELMLTKQHIVDSGEDLTVFEDAVARGRAVIDS